MTEQTPTRARDGDQDAFRELTDPYRRELRRHIYRIVGSPQDAEASCGRRCSPPGAGSSPSRRASVRAWLDRIATNRSLDALRAGRRRARTSGRR